MHLFNRFFVGASLFFLALLASGFVQAQTAVGLQLYTFRDQIPKDVPGMLKKIGGMGFRHLEGGGTYGLSKEEFKRLLQKNKLQMTSYGADFKDLETAPEKVVANARFFGAKYIMCAWVPHNGETFTIDDAKKAVAVFNKAGKAAAAKGIRFVYHAHGYEFQPYEKGTLFDYMLKNMNPAYANFEMDVFWFKNSGQDPAAWLLRHPNRFPLLHLKDRKPGTPDNVTAQADVETNVVLGSGDVNIAAVMKAAKKIGIRYAFIEDESSHSLEQVPQSLAYLKRLRK
ncbi:MAG TPA: sugar phosphate isomerase/epimerase [Flavisolibacter sp.]|nr:sugar phosphate isomerase/epimerase [Flavisolibacter sp.]